ncbi:MAG: PKD domain-containing protein, partial [Chloroflexi bacterium]|nr:PKD domain-containing protein [Chloroflexota bacterium]
PPPDNNPPVANAGGPYSGTQGQAVAFNGTGSSDADGDVLTYQWNFGDGGSASGATPTHTYTSVGVFTVSLTVNDGKGGSDSDSTTATIGAANQPPVANAGPEKTVTLGSAVTLDGSGSSDPDGTIGTYQWSLGNGATATGSIVTYTYPVAGTYTATLTVTDDKGATAQDTAKVTVLVPDALKLHVADMSIVIKDLFLGWQTWAEVTVVVVDASGAPVSGVTVSGQWSGGVSGTSSATTNASGVAVLKSPVLRRPPSGTVFTFTVTNLQKSGFSYDAGADVKKSASATI